MRRSIGWLMVVAAALLACPVGAAPASVRVRPSNRPIARTVESVRPNALTVAQYERLELTVSLHVAYSNPFDPDEVNLIGRFATPHGSIITVPGFYYREYTRSQLIDGTEQLEAAARASSFRIRFAWGEVGTYHYQVVVHDRLGWRQVGSGIFTVQAGSDPGYLHVSETAPRYFQFDSGASYFAIGENMGWPTIHGTYDYDDWLNKLADARGNYVRLWLANDWNWIGLEKLPQTTGDGNGLGKYDLKASWRVDYILDLARARGVRAMLDIESFNYVDATSEYGNWPASPYNAANGGPCATPADFFTDATARALVKRRLRYLVARWGYSPAVLSWELWNEVDLATGYDSAAVAAWHEEMAGYLRSIDPWQHMRTTSFCVTAGDPAVDSLPGIDYLQSHSYGAHDMAAMVQETTTSKWAAYGKPHYVGEYGVNVYASGNAADPNGIYLHNGLWASLFVGSAGAAMTWWWSDYIDPNDYYIFFTRIADYTADVDWVAEDYTPAEFIPTWAAGVTPVYSPLSIAPLHEAWVDGSIYNEPHTVTVGGDGVVDGFENLSVTQQGLLANPAWHNPVTFLVNYPAAGQFVVQVTGISGWGDGATLSISIDGTEVLQQHFADTDPDSNDTMHDYDGDYAVDVPAGAHTILVNNVGSDWFSCSYELTNYLTIPNLRVLTTSNATSALAWVQNRGNTWWRFAQGDTPTAMPASLFTLTGLTPGTYSIEQWDTYAGAVSATSTATSSDGTLTLTTPEGLTTDVAYKVRRTG